MKKLILVISLIFTVFAFSAFSPRANFAVAEEDGISTGIFLPTSYLQYYRLSNPYALCRYIDGDGKEVVAISHENEIVIYRDEKFSKIDISNITEGNPVTVVDKYENYILFLYASKIYSIDITGFGEPNWNNGAVYTGIYSSLGFSISGDVILTNDNNGVRFNKIDDTAEIFSLEEREYESIDILNTKSLLYSSDGNVYFSTTDDDICSYDTTTKETEVLWEKITGIRSIAEDGEGNIYYSCKNGVYAIEVATKKTKTIKTASSGEEKDLGNIYDAQGVCVTGKGLWVVDGALNAVQEIDLSDNSFTKFAITTNSKAINRLSDRVKDLCVDKDKIYALDDGRIVVINDIDGVNTYNKIDLNAKCDLFAVGDGKLLCYRSDTLYLYGISGEEETLTIEKLYEEGFTNVKDLCYSDGSFFVLSEELKGGKIYPKISEINASAKTLDLKAGDAETNGGNALKITADIFGNVYYATENGDNYEFFVSGSSSPIITREKGERELLKLQTDLDGNLYAMYSENFVERYEQSGEVKFAKAIKLSSNLESVNTPENPLVSKSMCLSYNSPTAYFLFDGLILKTSEAGDMDIATPSRITANEGFGISYLVSGEFGVLKSGAKKFFVKSDVSNGFEFFGKADAIETDEYAVFEVNGKYSLAVKGGESALVRTEDISRLFTATEKTETEYGYSAVAFDIYSVPVTESVYSRSGAKTHEKLVILSEISFNGKEFYAVRCENGEGYIPKSFVLSSIKEEDETEAMRSAYIFLKGGTTVYKDEDKTETLSILTKKTKVTVLGESGNRLLVEIDGVKGYADKNAEYSDGKSNTTKALAVILCALSLTAFALFFESKGYKALKGQ